MSSKASSNNHIVTTRAKRVEVMASPGSGKTHTLIERVQHLIGIGVRAHEILVLSFSNTSVREVRRRMVVQRSDSATKEVKLGQAATDLSKVTVKTAHSFAFGLIKKQEVLTDKKACALLAKAIRSVQRDCKKQGLWPGISPAIRRQREERLEELSELQQIKLVLNFLSVARASKMTLAETASTSQFETLKRYRNVLSTVRRRFTAIKRKHGVIDYADMLVLAGKAIEGGASVPFTHILVDEYQDCSAAQTHLLAQLARLDGRSVMVFGDPFQAIFGFGGASYTPLSSALEGVKKLSLPISHRLTAQTAALASAVAQLSEEQSIQTSRDGDFPVLVRDKSLAAQTKHVAQHIVQLIDNDVPPEQIVVLARTKALLQPVEQLLLANNVLSKRMGIRRNRRHALRVLKLVRLVERNEKTQKVVTPDMLHAALPKLSAKDSLWKRESLVMKKVARVRSLEGRYRMCAKVYLRLMGGVRADAELRADVNRWEASCRDYENARTMRDAIRMMETKAVVTGTIHSAKGGEWDHVLVVGVTDGLLPLYFARDDPQSLSEERNLLYVAITRAREAVRLYHAPANHARSRQRFEDISRFLDEPAVRLTLRIERVNQRPSGHNFRPFVESATP